MQVLKRLFRIYVYGSIHIALVGGLAFYLNQTPYSKEFIIEKSSIVILMVFFYYNLSQLICIKDFQKIQGSEELEWVNRNMTEIVFAMGFSIILLSLFYIKYQSIFIIHSELIYIGILGFIYFFIKRIPIIRNLLIGFSWYWMISLFGNPIIRVDGFYFFIHFYIISYIYDRMTKIHHKFIADSLILLPFTGIYSWLPKIQFI